MGGRTCLCLGAFDGWLLVHELIKRLGGRVHGEILSRADPCLDVARLDVGELQTLVERGQFVSRASSVNPHYELVFGARSGFCVGRNPLRLITYDKRREAICKCDALAWNALRLRRWGGEIPDCAARIELQLSRRWLREQGVGSFADFQHAQGSLVGKVVNDFFRLTESGVDRANKHQSRAETHPLWQAIQGAFAEIYGKPGEPLPPLDRSQVEPDRLLKQARGCLAAALAQRGVACAGYPQFLEEARKSLGKLKESPQARDRFMKELQYRAREVGK